MAQNRKIEKDPEFKYEATALTATEASRLVAQQMLDDGVTFCSHQTATKNEILYLRVYGGYPAETGYTILCYLKRILQDWGD